LRRRAREKRGRRATQRRPRRDDGEERGDGEHAVVELHGGVILEQVAPPRVKLGVARRHDLSRHEREGVEDTAGAKSGDERTARRRDADERDEARDDVLAPAARLRTPRAAALEQVGRSPHGGAEQDEREAEMRGEPILAHLGAHAQAAGDHPPSHRALRGEQHEQPGDPAARELRDAPAQHEPREGQGEGEAGEPRDDAVPELPEVDRLEAGERHIRVEALVLGDALVLLELGGPLRRGVRRDHPGHRLPLRDREAALGEPRRAADEDDGEAEHGPRGEPEADGAVSTFGHGVPRTVRRRRDSWS
jgi:hypothetical protein